jgi:heme exporter protein D
MAFTSSLGPHAAYILSSYAVGLVIIGGLILVILLRHRAAKQALAAAETDHALHK